MNRLNLFKELWMLLRQHRKLWLAPIIILLLILGVLLVLAQTSALAPFIYTIF
ncbi:MAG TPA: DUF5989 family protein [Bryobacteraceae bacterium]|jgi:hypothetical protein|nr:DUF5989 family protein [Bryobacteraceae bacterium]